MRLRPGVLDKLGLVEALEWYTSDFEKRTGITCIFEHDVIPGINDTVATTGPGPGNRPGLNRRRAQLPRQRILLQSLPGAGLLGLLQTTPEFLRALGVHPLTDLFAPGH